jgi:hypothetical protein
LFDEEEAMRLSLFLLGVSLVGMVGGAFLIGVWAVGVALVAWSAAVAGFAVLRDFPESRRQPAVTSLDPIERYRRSS